MTEPFIGEIKLVGFDFAPSGYARCAGQLLSIAQNSALFALLGTTYGGNGQTTFGLPNLLSRRAYHVGQGPGLPFVTQGEASGVESVTLNVSQMPRHGHEVIAVRGGAAIAPSTSPAAAVWANEVKGSPQNLPYTTAGPNVTMHPASISASGGGQPHENRPPYLALNYVIALYGIFPSRP